MMNSRRKASFRRLRAYEEWEAKYGEKPCDSAGSSTPVLDATQAALDAVGMVDQGPAGAAADLASAGIDLWRGDLFGAFLGLLAALPVVGTGVGVVRKSRAVARAGQSVDGVLHATDAAAKGKKCVGASKGLLNEGARATELADEALLSKLRARGFTIDQSAEIQRYLDYRKANAATFLEKDLLLRPNARKIEVLEEYLHNVQKDIGLMNKMTPAQMEVHVKDFMLRHKKMLGISDADAQWLKNWLDKAKGQ